MPKTMVDGKMVEWKDYPIQPKHINIEKHFWDAFGNSESETAALLIVRLCQQSGGWMPFTKEEIDAHANHNFHFNRLNDFCHPESDTNFVILGVDNKYRVTHEFIAKCFVASPAI